MKVYVFPPSPNARKVLMTLAETGVQADVEIVDLQKGEQRAAAFLSLNPNGKIPVLEMDDGTSLWESNAVVNRIASMTDTTLWPKSNDRYPIMQWQFWEACHWTPVCSKFIAKHFFGRDEVDLDAAAEDLKPLARVLDGHLAQNQWLVGENMTTADISVSAINCYRVPCQMPLDEYPNIQRWLGQVEATPAWQHANKAPEAA